MILENALLARKEPAHRKTGSPVKTETVEKTRNFVALVCIAEGSSQCTALPPNPFLPKKCRDDALPLYWRGNCKFTDRNCRHDGADVYVEHLFNNPTNSLITLFLLPAFRINHAISESYTDVKKSFSK